MARQESLIQWASNHRRHISLEAKEFDWSWKSGIPLFDFEVRVNIDGFAGVGRGSDPGETTALTKAIAEALERAVCASRKIPSVGVAAHTVSHLARENARLEALERHAFNQHLLNRWNFIPTDEVRASTSLPAMRFFRMRLPEPYHAILCFLSEAETKFIGLSCGTDILAALDKSALEVLRNHAAFLADPAAYHRISAEDPNFWFCHSEFLAEVESLLGQSSETVTQDPLPPLHTEKIDIAHLPSLAGCPAVFERAQVIHKDL